MKYANNVQQQLKTGLTPFQRVPRGWLVVGSALGAWMVVLGIGAASAQVISGVSGLL